MSHYGQLTGTDDDSIEGAWLVELSDDGTPRPNYGLIPVELMPCVVLVSSIELPITGEHRVASTIDDSGEIALLMMRRQIIELRGQDAES